MLLKTTAEHRGMFAIYRNRYPSMSIGLKLYVSIFYLQCLRIHMHNVIRERRPWHTFNHGVQAGGEQEA